MTLFRLLPPCSGGGPARPAGIGKSTGSLDTLRKPRQPRSQALVSMSPRRLHIPSSHAARSAVNIGQRSAVCARGGGGSPLRRCHSMRPSPLSCCWSRLAGHLELPTPRPPSPRPPSRRAPFVPQRHTSPSGRNSAALGALPTVGVACVSWVASDLDAEDALHLLLAPNLAQPVGLRQPL